MEWRWGRLGGCLPSSDMALSSWPVPRTTGHHGNSRVHPWKSSALMGDLAFFWASLASAETVEVSRDRDFLFLGKGLPFQGCLSALGREDCRVQGHSGSRGSGSGRGVLCSVAQVPGH